jgi:hypothetical protein
LGTERHFLGFDNTDELAVDDQRIVGRPIGGRVLLDRMVAIGAQRF